MHYEVVQKKLWAYKIEYEEYSIDARVDGSLVEVGCWLKSVWYWIGFQWWLWLLSLGWCCFYFNRVGSCG